MKRTIPLVIVFSCGIFMLISFFIPLRWVQDTAQLLQTWYLGVIAFFVFIGVANIVRVNVTKIQRKLADFGLWLGMKAGENMTAPPGGEAGGGGDQDQPNAQEGPPPDVLDAPPDADLRGPASDAGDPSAPAESGPMEVFTMGE